MKSQWFVIHTLSGQEQKVKESIEKRIKAEEMGEYIHEVLVPMEKVVEVRNQKKTVSTRKLWPGYVFIDMALLDTQVAMLANLGANYLVSGKVPGRAGNAHQNIVPYQVFEVAPAADGSKDHLILAVGNDGQFAKF